MSSNMSISMSMNIVKNMKVKMRMHTSSRCFPSHHPRIDIPIPAAAIAAALIASEPNILKLGNPKGPGSTLQ